jgi:SRP-independent targeting protein 2/TMEM208
LFSARFRAQGFYQPFLIGINVVYLITRQFKVGLWQGTNFWEAVVMLLFVALHYACYVSILDNAAAATSSSSSSSSSNNSKALVGGAALDYLAVVLVIQFGSVLISHKFYWLLLLIPTHGAWTLYQTFLGGGGSGKNAATSQQQQPAMPAATDAGPGGNRKQRRTEERKERRK